MAKFNSKSNSTIETNMENGIAYSRKDSRKDFINIIINSLLKNSSFYESEEQRIKNIENIIKKLIKDNEIEFLLKAMIYTRNVANLRSISHIVATLIVENLKGNDLTKPALVQTFSRVDDMIETFAFWVNRNKDKNIPNALRRAFKSALEKNFNEYQLTKYKATNKKIKLRDIVKIAHPDPKKAIKYNNDENIFKRVIENNTMKIETVVSNLASGMNAAENLEKMLNEKTLGYMAALKAIRNALEAGLKEETLNIWIAYITNKNAIKNSKVLPFRFYDAFEAVDNLNIDRIVINKVKKALETAFSISAENVGILNENERMAILLDESGSMNGIPFKVGKTLSASILTNVKNDDVVFYTWANDCTQRTISGSVFDFINNTQENGGGTDISAPFKKLIETKTFVDKIIIFTDMQMYSYDIKKYKFSHYVKEYQKINPNVKILFWNLEGYKTGTPITLNEDILEISGYSDNLLSVVGKLWENENALIDEINSIIIEK